MQVPIDKQNTNSLLLEETDIIPESGLIVQTSSGQAFLSNSGKTFIGKIEDNKKSFVVLTVFDDYVTGLIQNENGVTHTISPYDKINNEVIIKKLYKGNNAGNHNCSSVKTKKSIKQVSSYKSNGNCNQPCHVPCSGSTTVHVFYEMDFIAFLDEGNIQNCIEFMTSAHAVIHNIYNNITNVSNNDGPTNPLPGGVNMVMSGLFIWDTPDPYPNGSLEDRLDEFVSFRTTFNGDVAHLISKGTVDDGGIANIDTSNTNASICINRQVPTVGSPHSLSFLRGADNIDFDINTFSYGTALIAHEIGHNLGGRHPHEDRWYPDGTGDLYSIHGDASCDFDPIRSGPCTVTNYTPTIMSRCWNAALTSDTIDYTFPFHREIATNILFNLCDNDLCYEPLCDEVMMTISMVSVMMMMRTNVHLTILTFQLHTKRPVMTMTLILSMI